MPEHTDAPSAAPHGQAPSSPPPPRRKRWELQSELFARVFDVLAGVTTGRNRYAETQARSIVGFHELMALRAAAQPLHVRAAGVLQSGGRCVEGFRPSTGDGLHENAPMRMPVPYLCARRVCVGMG